ncbi:hypothetical protein P692DRAFT_201667545, partial [Suillus brevipes Sb2]
LIVQWTPGHHGIPSNEAADEHAKMAARGDNSAPNELPKSLLTPRTNTLRPFPISKSALKQQFGTIIKEESSQIMKDSPRYKRLHEID